MSQLTITEAVKEAMRINGKPLTIREAFELIEKLGLYEFNAENPAHVVASQIRRHCKDLDFPSASPTKHFELKEDGRYFYLEKPLRQEASKKSKDPGKGAQSLVLKLKALSEQHREGVKKGIQLRLQKLDPKIFEDFAKNLLSVYGFQEVVVTQYSKDGGIDGHGKLKVGLVHMNVAFQCKRYGSKSVGRPEVDQFRGAIQGQFEHGIFFTTSMFAKGVEEISFRPGAVPIILLDGPAIVDLMIEKQFGVQVEALPIYSYALDLVLEKNT